MTPCTRRLLKIAAALALPGAASLAAFALIGSEVDAQGVLHEPFFLLPMGWALLLAGLLCAASAGVCVLFRRR